MTKTFIENLDRNPSRFRNDDGQFYLEGYGFDGSIAPLTPRLEDDPFLQRAEKRGKIRFLNEEDAKARMAELSPRDFSHEAHQKLMDQSLSEDASDQVSIYKNPNLPTEAREQGSYDARQIWKGQQQQPAQQPQMDAHGRPLADTVQDPYQASEVTQDTHDDRTGVQPPSQVLTETVREGEMPPDNVE